jgi:apolipoprotein N-acyltransferase
MLKGVLVGIAIMVVYIFIPIVHFTWPVSPFISGYVGISFVTNRNDSASIRGLKFGAWIGLTALVLAVVTGMFLIAILDIGPKKVLLVWICVALVTFYSGSMSALGAMYAGLKNEKDKSSELDAI